MTRTPHDRRRNKPVAREQTADDVWAAGANAKVAEAMAAWLKGSVHLSRPISSLTRDEMTRLATNAVNTWIVLASQRVNDKTIPADALKSKLRMLLA